MIKLRRIGKKNMNTSSKEKQTKRKNQRKSKQNREDIKPKHVAVFVLLPGNYNFSKIMHKTLCTWNLITRWL